jgi:hypothetical protein
MVSNEVLMRSVLLISILALSLILTTIFIDGGDLKRDEFEMDLIDDIRDKLQVISLQQCGSVFDILIENPFTRGGSELRIVQGGIFMISEDERVDLLLSDGITPTLPPGNTDIFKFETIRYIGIFSDGYSISTPCRLSFELRGSDQEDLIFVTPSESIEEVVDEEGRNIFDLEFDPVGEWDHSEEFKEGSGFIYHDAGFVLDTNFFKGTIRGICPKFYIIPDILDNRSDQHSGNTTEQFTISRYLEMRNGDQKMEIWEIT